jgi:hypothetical protein
VTCRILYPSVKMARPVGLEPTAYRFEVWRSIQLSYGRALSELYAGRHSPAKMGWVMGLEPTTPGATVQCSTIELHPPY